MNRYFIQYPYEKIRAAYPSFIVRLYCLIRGHILRQKLLAEVGQYIPMRGRAIELGCGFGLFSLCFASTRPECEIVACDLNKGRIDMANGVAGRLGVKNCSFTCADAAKFVDDLPDFQCAYMFDLIHHMPRAAVPGFMETIWNKLEPGGVLIVKDVDTRPFHQMAFTWILDILMTGGELPDYWSMESVVELLTGLGGTPTIHVLDDYLPFPHRLYVMYKPV